MKKCKKFAKKVQADLNFSNSVLKHYSDAMMGIRWVMDPCNYSCPFANTG